MNFIITSDCNKGCPYCFASFHRKSIPESEVMTEETFIKLLDKVLPHEPIKLLGGEPTQHPKFLSFLNILVERKKSFTLISNFLFSEDIREAIIEAAKFIEISFLINSTNLDINEDRIKKFSENYNTIYKNFYSADIEERMSCGLTLENDKDWRYYTNYIDFLRKNLIKIETLRLSIPFPGNKNDKNNFYFLNNKDLGNKVLVVSKKAVDIGAIPSIDCIIFPCMFSSKEEYKYIKKFASNCKTSCESAPADVFPDETISYCYPTKEALKVNSKKHVLLKETTDELSMRYQILREKYKAQLPEACKSCKFLNDNVCHGPCLGFYDLSEEKIGINL